MAFCTKCGNQIPDDSAFCTRCGQPTGISQNGQVNSNPTPAPAPTFTPPTNNNGNNVAGFTPPANSGNTPPSFTPPTANNNKPNAAPTFTPPSGNKAAPTFTPPAQTFTPPRHSGPSCYYHNDEPAVARCVRCGKNLCQDCYDSYGFTSGQYAGQALCYDCTQQIVADDMAVLAKNKRKIKAQFIISLIGMGIGLIFGISIGSSGGFGSALLTGIIGAAIGGVFLSAMKVFFSMVWEVIKIAVSGQFGILTIFSILWNIIVLIFKCFITTISNTIYYIRYLRQTSSSIESDQAALNQMRDYMEYTMVRNKNRGVDIETLLQQNSELASNSVAQMARTQTEEQIEASMRNCVATINENGEIIRSFRDAA